MKTGAVTRTAPFFFASESCRRRADRSETETAFGHATTETDTGATFAIR
jgi:hypothetical protein